MFLCDLLPAQTSLEHSFLLYDTSQISHHLWVVAVPTLGQLKAKHWFLCVFISAEVGTAEVPEAQEDVGILSQVTQLTDKSQVSSAPVVV